jgi:GWxTD domain-containing protein
MNLLEHFVGSPIGGAIGWALLHSLWEGTIISALLAAVLMAVRSPRIRHAAACAAMLAMLMAFGLSIIYTMPNHVGNVRPLKAPTLHLGMLAESNTSGSWDLKVSSIAPWLGPFWLAGLWLVCIWRAANWLFVQRLRRQGLCCASTFWIKKVAGLCAQLRISRPVLLMESCLTDVPVLLGHFRPMILVPVGLLAGLPPQQVEAILLHELAHVARHDYLVNILQRLAEALLFYHPAAWWISRIIRVEREHCCDDAVVLLTGDAREYAVALAALETNRLSSREAALAATGGNLMKRIHRILAPSERQGTWVPFLVFAIFLAGAAVSLAAWRSEARTQATVGAQIKPDKPTPSFYSKWLSEEVVYIIDDAERGAFLQLTTDRERDHFIEQFWERRNPTPGSSTNKFKEEHYRRIAYANQHFGTASGAAGWETDRGHVLIVYGPPDEIESHPKGASRSFGTQIWLYRHIEGVGDNESITFIDRTGRSDFRLAPGNATAVPSTHG